MTEEEKKQGLEKLFVYDNEEGIAEFLARGLEGFHQLINARSEAGYTRKERLQEFIVLGRWWFDTCGNLFQLDTPGLPSLGPVLSKMKVFDVLPGVVLRGTLTDSLPKATDLCVLCGHGWKLEDVQDSAKTDIGRGGKCLFEFHHKVCFRIKHLIAVHAEFAQVFDEAGFQGKYNLNAVPNEYCDCHRCAPWFVAETPYGDIKMGWRKRVINIDWSGTKTMVPELFTEENVTKGATYIHAWGYDKAKEYLAKLLVKLKEKRDATGQS